MTSTFDEIFEEKMKELTAMAEKGVKIPERSEKKDATVDQKRYGKVLLLKTDNKDLNKILAFNTILNSGVVNHFVLNEETREYDLAGITTADGEYTHINENINEKKVIVKENYGPA